MNTLLKNSEIYKFVYVNYYILVGYEETIAPIVSPSPISDYNRWKIVFCITISCSYSTQQINIMIFSRLFN